MSSENKKEDKETSPNPPSSSSQGPVAWVHDAMRKITTEAREIQRKRELARLRLWLSLFKINFNGVVFRRRFKNHDDKQFDNERMNTCEVLQQLKSSKYANRRLLEWIKRLEDSFKLLILRIYKSHTRSFFQKSVRWDLKCRRNFLLCRWCKSYSWSSEHSYRTT